MRQDIIKKLDEADELVRPQIEKAKIWMQGWEGDKYSEVRRLIQEAITILHRLS